MKRTVKYFLLLIICFVLMISCDTQVFQNRFKLNRAYSI